MKSSIQSMNLPPGQRPQRDKHRTALLGRAWRVRWRERKDPKISLESMRAYTRWQDRWIWAPRHIDQERDGELERIREQTAGVILLDLIASGLLASNDWFELASRPNDYEHSWLFAEHSLRPDGWAETDTGWVQPEAVTTRQARDAQQTH